MAPYFTDEKHGEMGHREINQMFQGYRAVYVGVKISKPGSLDFSVGTLYTLQLTAFLSFFFSHSISSFFQIFLVLFYFFSFSLVVIFLCRRGGAQCLGKGDGIALIAGME